jgi:hypothetical protein
METVPSSTDPEAPDLFLEPVIGWRTWGLERDGHGRLVLSSPMRSFRWEPMVPTRASCPSGTPAHRPPEPRCGCGLYAAARLERLPRLMTGFSGLAVVGSVAMWGTVVEHTVGYRGEFAYPDRLRLVCAPCFASGLVGAPTKIVRRGSGLAGVCDAHLVSADAELLPITPTELQLELLSTYAVDLLPEQVMCEHGFTVDPPGPGLGFPAQARYELHRLVRSPTGRTGVIALVLAFFVLRALGILTSPEAPEPSPAPAPVTVASPLPGTGDPVRSPLGDASGDDGGGSSEVPFPAFVCGRLMGTSAALVDCARGNAVLLGTAWSPPAPRKDCEFGNAYTAKEGFSICWLDLTRPPDGSDPTLAILQLPGVHRKDIAWD